MKDKFFTKADFQFMMRNLPVPVEEEDIDQMFDFWMRSSRSRFKSDQKKA